MDATGRILQVGGYVKLSKLWERSKKEAIEYHHRYYKESFSNYSDCSLFDVYVDITGQKEIYRRPEMLRLISDCLKGAVDVIVSQTKAYIAANPREFFFLLKYLFDRRDYIELVTEDDDFMIDTITNVEHQKEELRRLADNVATLDSSDYIKWCSRVERQMQALGYWDRNSKKADEGDTDEK